MHGKTMDQNEMKETVKTAKPRGRPPAFCHEQALERALHVFWRRGYEGASMAELTEALGMNKPSIYAAFGNKEELFRKALAHYQQGAVAYVGEALQAPTARQAVETLLRKSAELLTNPANQRGCMMVQGALSCGESATAVQQELIGRRRGFEEALVRRFEQAKAAHELPADTDCRALAKYIATVHQGMSVQATSGATREELDRMIDLVLKSWPQ
jgi:AcrR family transcriptional regulator